MTAPAGRSALQPAELGPDGEPCAGCGMPLARRPGYCLECGQRRGGRPAFRSRPPRPSRPAAAVPRAWFRGGCPGHPGLAACAVLLFALGGGLGVLIGSLGEDRRPRSASRGGVARR